MSLEVLNSSLRTHNHYSPFTIYYLLPYLTPFDSSPALHFSISSSTFSLVRLS
jgi:hypothetical protein